MPEASITLIFTTSFIVALSGVITPGPLLVLTLGEAARKGFWAGPLLVVGHGILELALVVVMALGLSKFAVAGLAWGLIGMVGGMVLIGMGLTTISRGWQGVAISTADPASRWQNKMLVLSGVLGSVSNPFWFIWWATVGLAYLLWSLRLGMAGVASFFTGHILADLSWYALVAFIAATGKRAMNATVYRSLLLVCGLSLVVLGGYFIVSGVKFLIG